MLSERSGSLTPLWRRSGCEKLLKFLRMRRFNFSHSIPLFTRTTHLPWQSRPLTATLLSRSFSGSFSLTAHPRCRRDWNPVIPRIEQGSIRERAKQQPLHHARPFRADRPNRALTPGCIVRPFNVASIPRCISGRVRMQEKFDLCS